MQPLTSKLCSCCRKLKLFKNYFFFLSWLMKRDFAGREELPLILCFICFKLKRWQKAAGASLCQECFWQTFGTPGSAQALEGRGKFWFIFLDKPVSNLLRDHEIGEVGEDLFIIFYPFPIGFLAGFWLSCWL